MTSRLWLIAPAVPCLAQIALSQRDAVARAMEQHPLLAVSAQRSEVAAAQRVQAGIVPNPKLILQSENTRPYGNPSFVFLRDTDNFAYLQNTFETAGKRGRRVETAEAAQRRTEAETALVRQQIRGRVAAAYWTAAGAARVLQLLREDGATMRAIVGYHEVRVREGAMAEADLIRVRLEAQRLAVATNQSRLDLDRARIQLLREMGSLEYPEATFTDPVDRETPVPAAVAEDAFKQREELRVARLAIDQAEANQRLQAANARPNVDVVFGYKRTGGLDTMLGGVQVDLPFSNRNQGGIMNASAELRLAKLNLAAAEALIRAELAAAESDYRIRRNEITTALAPAVEQAAETYRIADAAYRAGGSDLLRLLDAQRLRTETQIAFARGQAELRQSEAALRAAMGMEP
ncbi:MAG: TolC family protein [Acidobacteria bacterium]|nr:TolC family protein [Acidobacteriota bacterium]